MKKILPCLYRSQRDNADRPGAACNTTSMVMVLEASGISVFQIKGMGAAPLKDDSLHVGGKQPEDYLTEIGDSPAAYAEMRQTCPWFFNQNGQPTVRPPEAPYMRDWIVQQAYGKPVLTYHTAITFSMMMSEIDRGHGVVIEGQFTAFGHIVALVGYEATLDIGGRIGDLTGLIINDPWGDFLSGYKNTNGEHITLPIVQAMRILRQPDVSMKTGHIVVG